eukprot:SAG11_NODE_233_length_11903_cov_4.983650_3_plen_194_part_00
MSAYSLRILHILSAFVARLTVAWLCRCRFHVTARDDAATETDNVEAWTGRFFLEDLDANAGEPLAANIGAACGDHISGNFLPRPYFIPGPDEDTPIPSGYPCTPVVAGQFCVPRFATSYKTNADAERANSHRASTDRSTGHAMKFPPQPVYIAIKDNDRLRDQLQPRWRHSTRTAARRDSSSSPTRRVATERA